MRDYKETIEWYQNHHSTSDIGFNPDGMCLKVCRTARGIPSRYLTAVDAQRATPDKHRVRRVEDLRRGMVLYYDDPSDSNRAGHIATMVGRVPGYKKDSLSDILVVTNSVIRGQLTTVRGDYFPNYWGDPFVFGATWLNGFELDIPTGKNRVQQFHEGGRPWDLSKLRKVSKDRPAVKRGLEQVDYLVSLLPNTPQLPRIAEFRDRYTKDDVLAMGLLNDFVKEHPNGRVRRVRDGIREVLNNLPEK